MTHNVRYCETTKVGDRVVFNDLEKTHPHHGEIMTVVGLNPLGAFSFTVNDPDGKTMQVWGERLVLESEFMKEIV